jgi:hypothetical protein
MWNSFTIINQILNKEDKMLSLSRAEEEFYDYWINHQENITLTEHEARELKK